MTNHDVEGRPQGSSGEELHTLSITSMLDRDTLLVTVMLEQVRQRQLVSQDRAAVIISLHQLKGRDLILKGAIMSQCDF